MASVWRAGCRQGVVVAIAAVAMTTGCMSGQSRAAQAPGAKGASASAVPRDNARAGSVASYCSPAYQAQFGWPDPDKAARVCQCESSGNPRAASPNGKYFGLFQFSSASWQAEGGGDIFHPFTHSHHAHKLFAKKGWRPWPHCGRD